MRADVVKLEHGDFISAAILAGIILIAGFCQMVIGVCGVYHDDGIYVITAKAIAAGHGYRLIDLPNTPAQTKYPFLYPLVLSVIWKLWPVFPENLLAMQGLSLLTGGAAVAVMYLYLVRFSYFSRSIALAAGLLCGTCYSFLCLTGLTMSEMPFALALALSLWALDNQVRASSSSRVSQFFLGNVAAVPFLCRSVGLALLPAGLLVLHWSSRPIRWVVLGATIALSTWGFWIVVNLEGGNQINGPLMYYTDYFGWWSSHGLPTIGRVLMLNMLMLVIHTILMAGQGLTDFLYSLDLSTLLIMPCLTLFVTTSIYLWRQLRERILLPWFLISYLVIVCLWPWPPARFLIPVLPFLFAYLIGGVWMVLKRFVLFQRHNQFGVAALSVLIAFNLISIYQGSIANRSGHYPRLSPTSVQVSWTDYEDLFTWLKEHSKPEDSIASALDTMTYLYTGRRAFRPYVCSPLSLFYGGEEPPVGTINDLSRNLESGKARYLVQTPMPGFQEERPFHELLCQLIENQPALLKPVYVGKDERFRVFEVKSSNGVAGR